MTTMSYDFNSNDRIGVDQVGNTQRQLQNTRFSNYMLSSYFSESLTNDTVSFATRYPTINLNGLANGDGLNSVIVDMDSALTIGSEQERALEKLQLMQRPFVTIPYLGRGTVNPDLESQLLQGESIFEKKGISTVMTQSFMPYIANPVNTGADSSFEVEEYALQGWIRGGVPTREQYGHYGNE